MLSVQSSSGVDSSTSSLAAVRWAAATAARRRAPLHLVHAIGVSAGAVPVPGSLLFDTSGLRKAGDAALGVGQSIAQEVAGSAGEIPVRTFLESSSPVSCSARLSANARPPVVGARGLGAFERVLLGSVGIGLIRHASCPVAVVPGFDEPVAAVPQYPVLVGVDGSLCSERAVEIAFDEASVRRLGLALLVEKLAIFSDKYPEVRVHRLVAGGHPAQRLLEESHRAQLIVLASRGRGEVAGAALGSVSHAVLQKSRTPVVLATRGQ
ncbi:universal stress protein [Nocardia asiatica]|uniref:universal stress protein n=1 Tax=Nocardia asiatica TaxID=209252 RepID=UPI0002F4DFF4|nr:universal stress protein [Nocardia asiatica]